MGEKIRLDKYLAEMGLGTRSQIKEAAKKGRIKVDGTVEKRTEQKIDPDCQNVSFDGKEISYVKKEYYLLNKPQGVVSATEDKVHKTVLDLIDGKQRKDLFPVGRLDIDTEGLLILTNDGQLTHDLTSPKKNVYKKYFAKVDKPMSEADKKAFADGMEFKDFTAKPARLELTEKPCEVYIEIAEGKFHQVKRMCERVGKNVVYLKRTAIGGLCLDETLGSGEMRELTDTELQILRH